MADQEDKRSTEIRDKVQRAFEKQRVVRVDYEDKAGNKTTRLIRPLRWRDPFVILAYCYLRNDERYFRIGGIKTQRSLKFGHKKQNLVSSPVWTKQSKLVRYR